MILASQVFAACLLLMVSHNSPVCRSRHHCRLWEGAAGMIAPGEWTLLCPPPLPSLGRRQAHPSHVLLFEPVPTAGCTSTNYLPGIAAVCWCCMPLASIPYRHLLHSSHLQDCTDVPGQVVYASIPGSCMFLSISSSNTRALVTLVIGQAAGLLVVTAGKHTLLMHMSLFEVSWCWLPGQLTFKPVMQQPSSGVLRCRLPKCISSTRP